MKKYEAYKNPDIEWMEEIPVHWDVKSLKSTTDGNSSSFIDGDWIESPVITDDGIRYLTTGNVGVINYKEQGNGYISEQTFNDLKCSEVFPGDILISRLNLPLSRCCIVPELGKRIVTAVDNVIYRPDSQYHDKLYMVYLLNSARYAEYAGTLGRGTTMKRISRSALAAVKVCIPPLSEQQAIASYLDHRVGQIDASISAINAQIDDLKAYRMSVISEAVTKGLNPNAPMKDSGIEWIGSIPEHWEVSKVKWECAIMDYLREPINAENRKNELGLYDYYGASGVIDKIDDYNVDDKVLLIGEDGANLVMRNLPLVYKAEGKFWVNNHAHILKPLANNCYSYMAYMLEAGDYTHYITGSAQPKLSQDNIKNFIIPMPRDYTEQQAIASYLDNKTSKIDAAIASLESQRDDLNALKQSVISEAVTGKIDVRGWKLNNEQ